MYGTDQHTTGNHTIANQAADAAGRYRHVSKDGTVVLRGETKYMGRHYCLKRISLGKVKLPELLGNEHDPVLVRLHRQAKKVGSRNLDQILNSVAAEFGFNGGYTYFFMEEGGAGAANFWTDTQLSTPALAEYHEMGLLERDQAVKSCCDRDYYAMKSETSAVEKFAQGLKREFEAIGISGLQVSVRGKNTHGWGAIQFHSSQVDIFSAMARRNMGSDYRWEVLTQLHMIAAYVQTILDGSGLLIAHTAEVTYEMTNLDRQIIKLAANGMDSNQIGAVIERKKRFVDHRFQQICEMLGAASRTQAVVKAIKLGYI